MAKLNPIEQSEYIENEFREYIKSTFRFNDVDYQNNFVDELDRAVLYKGPFLSINLPFVTSKSLNELIGDGTVSSNFKKLSGIDLEQKLYRHQEEALNKICAGKNTIITTGTGSGKTESFLYPVFNSIMRDIEKGNNEPGIRALLLYPMNALVNDQIDRIRKMLSGYPEIKYAFFTGETPEKAKTNARAELSKENGVLILENELISREEIRQSPPHLLFTNYSMLEYLMIRPNDSKIFNKQYLQNWEYIILDEAHVYNGALGIEVSLLLRRLTGLADKQPNFILTSATLGDKGRDEGEIINFAHSLTSREYSPDDIIFSTREKLDSKNIEYTIEPNKYIELEKELSDLSRLKELSKEYIAVEKTSSSAEFLYELLIRDSNVYELISFLAHESLEFNVVLRNMSAFFKKDELVSLISLINKACKNKKKLYDIKYHTFVNTLSGAFITLSPNKKLRLSNCFEMEGLKTFELGNCRFCNTSYIIGKIRIDSSGENYLYQNTDIDIYENYGDNENIVIDYFLISDSLNFEEVEMELCEEKYTVCSKCARIYASENLNAVGCNCGEIYAVELIKVKTPENEVRNNVLKCPCCQHQARGGVVRSLNLGKDEATAILAQILYKAIDPNNEETIVEKKSSLTFSIEKNKEKEIVSDAKQFLAFSDSRQQASFFASFYEYNHKRFLRKRLLWDELEKNSFEPITVSTLVSRLTAVIDNQNLFVDDELDAHKQAWISALYELLNVDGDYSAEGLGLFHFELDLDGILNKFDDDAIESEFGKYNITREKLKHLLNVIFYLFRTTPAIDYDVSELAPKERENELGYRRFTNYVKLEKPKGSKDESGFNQDGNIKSFIPVNKKGSNNQLDYVMKVCKCGREEAVKVLETLFEVIGSPTQGALFTKTDKFADEAYRIEATKYMLKCYKNTKYFMCSKCKNITPFNVHNVCPTRDCEGTLLECDPDKELAHNYYRRQYKTKKIESMMIKEHTAQLSTREAKEYQKEFKAKRINILSCSTTFEMGVDIGGLETVFLRNVPPTPANYVQRAGRAGRRDDSSAFVLTFCGNSSHDYTYFLEPNKMISGSIRPPKFSVTNEKIILRHLLATAFGYFFRKYPEIYENIDVLICDGGMDKFKEYLNTRPEDLNNYINEKILTDNVYGRYCDFKWYELLLDKNDNRIDKFIESINSIIAQYEEAKDEATKLEEFTQAAYYKGQIKRIKKDGVIQYLSKYNVIPKYGFPVDTVELQIYENGERNTNYDLNRDLTIAISEYAPDSEIIVDKVKYTSRYISLPRGNELTKYYYYTCVICERKNIDRIPNSLDKCKYCEKPNSTKIIDYFIIPEYGFKTGPNKDTSTRKPKKSYAGETVYIGNGISDANKPLAIGNNNYITVETSSDDELLVMNENPFYMCERCGYTEIRKNVPGRIPIPVEHNDYRGKACPNKNLHVLALGHRFKTDVARISIANLNDIKQGLSFLYALLEGISLVFNIERTDINGLLVRNKDVYDLIIYDAVPGGAGHVKRIMDKKSLAETFEEALRKVSQNCCDEKTSCYNCLRNYSNQSKHKYLRRAEAISLLNIVLKNINSEGYFDSLIKFDKKSAKSFKNASWKDIEDEYNIDLSFETSELKVPDYVDAHFVFENEKISVLFVYEKEKIIIYDELTNKESLKTLKRDAWVCYNLTELPSVDVLKKEFVWQG